MGENINQYDSEDITQSRVMMPDSIGIELMQSRDEKKIIKILCGDEDGGINLITIFPCYV